MQPPRVRTVPRYNQTKKGRREAGLSVFHLLSQRSVLRNHRATPAIVDANRNEIDVLSDAVGAEEGAGRVDEGVGAILHEQVVVFDSGRPVGGEAVFEAHADHATPAGVVTGGGNQEAG